MQKEDVGKKEISFFINILRKHMPNITRQYKVKYLGIFGSYIRNSQVPSSDLDLLVEFSETPSLFDFIRLENYLSELLNAKVDLVMKDSLKPTIGKRILKEVVQV